VAVQVRNVAPWPLNRGHSYDLSGRTPFAVGKSIRPLTGQLSPVKPKIVRDAKQTIPGRKP
jgi:hypothetical protein